MSNGTQTSQPTWDSIDRQLDQNMPTAQRDKIRNHYFDQYIAPKVRTGYSVEDTRADWLKRTEKPLPPMSERIAGTLVNLAMEGAAFTALSAAFGPLSAGLARTLFGASDAATVAAAIGRGGMAMATMNALEASDGDRVRAGVRGAALGAAWDLGIGTVFGFGEKAMRAAEADAIAGVPARREAGAVAPAGGRFEYYGTAPRRPGEPRPYDVREIPTRRIAGTQKLLTEGEGALSEVPVVREAQGLAGRRPDFQRFEAGPARPSYEVSEVVP